MDDAGFTSLVAPWLCGGLGAILAIEDEPALSTPPSCPSGGRRRKRVRIQGFDFNYDERDGFPEFLPLILHLL